MAASSATPQTTQKRDDDFIPYCRHSIGDDEIREVVDTLKSDWLTTGPKALRFEQMFKEYVGCKHAIAVSSCTAALHLALCSYDIGPGDEVITTPFTFASTAEVIEYRGAKPVFVDIDPTTFNIDPARIEERITQRTRAIIPVHYGGIPCDLNAIGKIADRHGLAVVEDAAHAVGSEYGGAKIGSHGNPTAFSFYPTKNMTTGEGGIIAVNDDEIGQRLRVLSLHGISKDAWKRYSKQGQWYYEIHDLGYKYNFTDLQAALGIQQLARLDAFNARREQLARIYMDELRDVPGLRFPRWYSRWYDGEAPAGTKSAWHLFVMLLDNDQVQINRDEFVEQLKLAGIGTSVHFIPLHLQPYYARKYGYKRGDFAIAEQVFDQLISLPLYPKLTESQLGRVIDVIKTLIGKHRIE